MPIINRGEKTKIVETRKKEYWNGGEIKCRGCGTKLQTGFQDLVYNKKWKSFYDLPCPECGAIAKSINTDDIAPTERKRAKKIARTNLVKATRGLERLFLPLFFLADDHPNLTVAAIVLIVIIARILIARTRI
jgi:hypothetical protein